MTPNNDRPELAQAIQRACFGPGLVDTAELMTSAEVTLIFNEVYGHVDYVFSANHLHEGEHPILNWLLQEGF